MYTKVRDPLSDAMSAELIRRDADGALIPADPTNVDWQTYRDWLAAGNAPAEPERTSPVAA